MQPTIYTNTLVSPLKFPQSGPQIASSPTQDYICFSFIANCIYFISMRVPFVFVVVVVAALIALTLITVLSS